MITTARLRVGGEEVGEVVRRRDGNRLSDRHHVGEPDQEDCKHAGNDKFPGILHGIDLVSSQGRDMRPRQEETSAPRLTSSGPDRPHAHVIVPRHRGLALAVEVPANPGRDRSSGRALTPSRT